MTCPAPEGVDATKRVERALRPAVPVVHVSAGLYPRHTAQTLALPNWTSSQSRCRDLRDMGSGDRALRSRFRWGFGLEMPHSCLVDPSACADNSGKSD